MLDTDIDVTTRAAVGQQAGLVYRNAPPTASGGDCTSEIKYSNVAGHFSLSKSLVGVHRTAFSLPLHVVFPPSVSALHLSSYAD